MITLNIKNKGLRSTQENGSKLDALYMIKGVMNSEKIAEVRVNQLTLPNFRFFEFYTDGECTNLIFKAKNQNRIAAMLIHDTLTKFICDILYTEDGIVVNITSKDKKHVA